MPSEYARAYDNIRPSVVRVMSYVKKSRLKEDAAQPAASGGAKPKPLGPAAGEGGPPAPTTRWSTAWAPAWSSSTRA